MNYTWQSYTFQLGNKAYKQIRPITIELIEEFVVEQKSFLFIVYQTIHRPSGRWMVQLKYDLGPTTMPRIDRVLFDDYRIAQGWFNQVYNMVFLQTNPGTPPPPPPTKIPKKQHKAKQFSLIKGGKPDQKP